MAIITEDYVSFEIAKLLKEKGFAEKCRTYYKVFPKDRIAAIYHSSEDRGVSEDDPNEILCPTLQMVMKWLRIEHNIHIEPHIVRTKCSYGYMPNYVNLKELKQHFPFDEVDFSNTDKYVCMTYDKACEVTIKYCLENLI